MTIPALHQMKRDRRKIVGVVAWDFQIAQIADRAGVEIVSVGDSVGINLWGHATPLEVTMDEMLIVCKAVRRGTRRALVSCDLPYGPLQESVESAVRAATRLMKDGGADMVKLDAAAECPEAVTAMVKAGIPVSRISLELSLIPEGVEHSAEKFVNDAKTLEAAGPILLDFTHSGPVAGPAVVNAVSIPVLGGMGGGPWLDGPMRMAHAAIGYPASSMESKTPRYANVAQITLDALTAYSEDVRASRQIKS